MLYLISGKDVRFDINDAGYLDNLDEIMKNDYKNIYIVITQIDLLDKPRQADQKKKWEDQLPKSLVDNMLEKFPTDHILFYFEENLDEFRQSMYDLVMKSEYHKTP